MWIFTDIGFFSVVRHWKNQDRMVVRARCKDDLNNLIDRHGPDLDRSRRHILITPDDDYCCRLIVDAGKWSAVLSKIACNVDYTNFKDAVHRRMGHERADVYMGVWHTMYDMQHSLSRTHSNFIDCPELNTSPLQSYYSTNETPTNTSRGEPDNVKEEHDLTEPQRFNPYP